MPWDVIGHTWAVELLQRDLAHDRPRHAYLITGPDGIGKRTLAAEFARALVCTAGGAAAPCGQCRPCQLAARGGHPDLLLVTPEVSGKKVRSEKIKIDPVRQLIYDLTLKPVEARRRVARLLRFDAANVEAMNAFLKTLEEPPANVVIVLTAESADALLPTIVSRCEVLALRPLALAEVREALITRWLVSAEQADHLAHLSGGRLGWAVRAHANPDLLEARRQRLDDLRRLLTATRVERFAYADRLVRDSSSDRLQEILELWMSFWRDVLLSTAQAAAPLTNPDCADDVQRLARALTPASAHSVLTGLRRAHELLGRNINARLTLEVLLLDWPRL